MGGISGTVDLSRFNGSVGDLAKIAGPEVVPVVQDGPQLYLRNSNTTGIADTDYIFAAPRGGKMLMCDWDGDGTATARRVPERHVVHHQLDGRWPTAAGVRVRPAG